MIYLKTAYRDGTEVRRRVDFENYPDGTQRISVEAADGAVSENTIVWHYGSDSELVSAAFLAQNLKECDKAPVVLYMPYLPNARMDRTHSGTEVFTLKYFCKFINSLEFSKIIVLDVHSPVGTALLDRVTENSPRAYIERSLESFGFDKENDYIFFPDEGSCKRYTAMFSDCRHIGFGIKKRDWAAGKIKGLEICGDSPKGRRVFIVDDICAYGGTVYHSAKQLKELGCGDIAVFFTHCENSIEKGELFTCGLIKHIYTTNSLCTLPESEMFTVMDCTLQKG